MKSAAQSSPGSLVFCLSFSPRGIWLHTCTGPMQNGQRPCLSRQTLHKLLPLPHDISLSSMMQGLEESVEILQCFGRCRRQRVTLQLGLLSTEFQSLLDMQLHGAEYTAGGPYLMSSGISSLSGHVMCRWQQTDVLGVLPAALAASTTWGHHRRRQRALVRSSCKPGGMPFILIHSFVT